MGAFRPNGQPEAVALPRKRLLAWAGQQDDKVLKLHSLVGETEAGVLRVRHAHCPEGRI